MTLYEVSFRFHGTRRYLLECSGEDEAAEQAEEKFNDELHGVEIEYLDVRPVKAREVDD